MGAGRLRAARVLSVNVGRPTPNPYKQTESTGIAKMPQDGSVHVRAPGPRRGGLGGGLGSGLVGDYIGDVQHHGGDDQAVYAFAREDLNRWEQRLGRPLPSGSFGENLTTEGLDVSSSRLGERWRIGESLELEVRDPRIPCATFRGWIKETGWLKTFTQDRRPGAYLRVVQPGTVCAGDPIQVVFVPGHDVTISLVFRALTTEHELLGQVAAAGDHIPPELRQRLRAWQGSPPG